MTIFVARCGMRLGWGLSSAPDAAQQECCEPGSTLLCMGLFSRFFVQALPCTAEGTLCRVQDTRSLVPRAYGTNRSNSNTSCSSLARNGKSLPSGEGFCHGRRWRALASGRLLRLQKITDLEQDEFVVVGLVGIAARGERQVVVVADDDMRLVDTVDVFDGEERERQHTLVERLARLVVGILDLHQVDIGDLAHRL